MQAMTLAPHAAHLPGIKIDIVPGSCDEEQVVIIILDKTYACNTSNSTEWWSSCGFARVIQSIPLSDFRVISFSPQSGITLVGTTVIPRMTPHRVRIMLAKAWDEYINGADPRASDTIVTKEQQFEDVIFVSEGRVTTIKIAPRTKRVAKLMKQKIAAHLYARGLHIHDPFICNNRHGATILVSSGPLGDFVPPEELHLIFKSLGVHLTIVHEIAA